MDEKVKVKNTKVFDYFNNMEYGENMENLNKAYEWFKENTFFAYIDKTSEPPNGTPTILRNSINAEELCKIHVPEIDTIKKILIKCNEKSPWTSMTPVERRKILLKLSTEIEKNADLFTQIEIMTRGILGSDTKKWAIPLFAQYFRYYAYCISSVKKPRQKGEGLAVGVFSNKNSLSNLGLFLAPVLSAGYNIVLQVGTELAPVTFLLLDIAKSVGIPEDAFRLIPSDDGDLSPYYYSNNKKVGILTVFADLHGEKYQQMPFQIDTKILNLSSNKGPIIIFDDADLDSACENLIEASWAYQSLLPWSANTVLVQENVFPTFLNKLKSKLRSLKIGPANNKMIDIAHRTESSTHALASLIALAKSQGIEIFQADEECTTWSPTLFIGAKVRTSNVLSSDSGESDEVTVLAFRYIDEAVNLANNTRQGLAASVWSENIGVVNEVIRKLDVSNVWVNSWGTISPEVTLSPLKDTGVGHFGGIEGLLEYVSYERKLPAITKSGACPKSNVSIDSLIVSAKKSQASWSRTSNIEKRQLFQEFADYLDSQQQTKNGNSTDWIISAITTFHDSITNIYKERVTLGPSFNLISLRQPKGVISVDVTESNNAALILTALFSGNALIVSCDGDYFETFKKLSSILPNGVLNVLPYNCDTAIAITRNKLVAVHFSCSGSFINGIGNYKMSVSDDIEDIYNKVTVLKNVWYDSGKSSNCN